MSKAIYEPNGLHLLVLKESFERIYCEEYLNSTQTSEASLDVNPFAKFRVQLAEYADNVKPLYYEERDGIPSKKRIPRRVSKKSGTVVGQHIGRFRTSDQSDRDRPDWQPPPSEQEGDNDYEDVG